MPDFHEAFLESLFTYIKGGNAEIRFSASECLVKILQYQYSTEKRKELIATVKTDLAESSSCVLRKTFIYFCRSAVQSFSRSFFKANFLETYLSLSKDKVATVRMEFAHSVIHIKPYLDNDDKFNLDLMDVLNLLKQDSNRDVIEAIEQADFNLLK